MLTSGLTRAELDALELEINPFDPSPTGADPTRARRERAWNRAEDAKLADALTQAEAAMRTDTAASLDEAVSAVAGDPELAWMLVDEAR